MGLSFRYQSEFPESRAGLPCRDIGAGVFFFPGGTIGPTPRQIDEAQRICRAYPTQAACLAWTMDGVITA
jgi:hypothetical protein